MDLFLGVGEGIWVQKEGCEEPYGVSCGDKINKNQRHMKFALMVLRHKIVARPYNKG